MGSSTDPQLDATEHRLGRRQQSRLRVSLSARLTSIGGTQIVQLLNVSQNGLMVSWKSPVREGGDVVLVWSKFELFGQVVWASAHQGGILSDRPLPEALLLSLRAIERETV